ncbi:serine/threonine protein kinase [Streptomyces sp. NPDC050560]|uniref:serine/threonine protein kinase n=1 Tax=Streptomyces sp. NPDC050560 TaxID=3365630 RepID=UPI003788E4FD
MAERSTSAVDVADTSGDTPLTAKAERTTADEVAQSPERSDTDDGRTEADEADRAPGSGDPTDTTAPMTPVDPQASAEPTAEDDAPAPDEDPGTAPTVENTSPEAEDASPEDDASRGDGPQAPEIDADAPTVPDVLAATDTPRTTEAPRDASESPDPDAPDGPADAAESADGAENAQDAQDAQDTRDTQNAEGDSPGEEGEGGGSTTSTQQLPEPEPPAPVHLSAPDLHSGHKLADRYRLEECVTRLDGFSSWRAVDEKLRRAVGVHLLLSAHPRARSVLAAARSSALLGDPRFVQVLDAVEEDDLVYVVHEWLPDAVEMTALLAAGPLPVHDAYLMVSQVSQAMAAAHREGLAHLRLTPSAVLRTSTGEWRIRGLAVNAALRGITSDTPRRTDTEAIGALLYAALTERWPYEDDAYGLSGLPRGVGLIAPDQVRAGVHRGLSELAMRALANNGATASRQEPPCTTPEDLVKAVAEMPRVPPPEPVFPVAAQYQQTTYQQGTYRRTAPQRPTAAVVPPPPPPPLQSRTGTVLKWAVSALLIVALGLGSWQLADALMNRSGSGSHQNGGSSETDSGSDKKDEAPGKPLEIAGATEFAPNGSTIKPQRVPLAIDGNASTAWVTDYYKGYPEFGNLPQRKDGSGIIVDLGSVQSVTGLEITMSRAGQRVEVLAAGSDASDPSALGDFSQRLTPLAEAGKTLKKGLGKSVKTQYVLVHITSLAPDDVANQFRGGISEIKVIGNPSQ